MSSVFIRSRPSSLRFKICCSAKKETFDKVVRIVREQLHILDSEAIPGNASFVEDLGADSLSLVELMLALEEAFDIEIPDEITERMATVQAAADQIEKLLQEKDA